MSPSDRTRCYFESAGWRESQSANEMLGNLHPAVYVLRQFGGLHVGIRKPPSTRFDEIFSDIRFSDLSEIEHLTTRPVDEIPCSAGWSKLLHSPLVCIAQYHLDHGLISIAGDGRVFVRSQIHDAMGFQSDHVSIAMEEILLGTRTPDPMIRPDQESVSWCGRTFTHGDRELYVYQ